MVKKIKKHKDIVFVLGIGLVLTIASVIGLSGIIALPGSVSAATDTVSVTATIEAWMTFSANPTSTTLTPYLVTSVGETNVASSSNIVLSLGTNHTSGWNIQINGLNDGLKLSGTTISSVTGTSTIVAGTDGYGANATNTFSGVTIGSYYLHWGNTDVGEIKTVGQTLASKTSENAVENVVSMKIYAGSSDTNPAGDYLDTITLTATTGT